MKISFSLFAFIFPLLLSAQDKPAYRIFTGDGKRSDYREMIKAAEKASVIFFGEIHDDPVAHWLELEVTNDLYKEKGNDLVLAAEMFETDNQLLIDEYFSGIIKESSFESEVRLWSNYKTDYKPLLNFAREHDLKFIASNIPRRYAAVVSSGGFEALEALSPVAISYIAPLPIDYDPELPCYKDMLSMGHDTGNPMAKNMSQNLPKAQAIKDATMANSIVKNSQPSNTVIHFNGSYHSARHMGIIWYLDKYRPGLRITTITSVMQDDISILEKDNLNEADFIIVVPSTMTRTF